MADLAPAVPQNITRTNSQRLQPVYRELESSASIYPGCLVEVNAGKLRPHSTAGGAAQMQLAQQNNALGGGIYNEYPADSLVSYAVYGSGVPVYLPIKAGAAAILNGAKLTSGGGGCFKLATGTDVVLAWANQTLDNSGSDSSAFIKATTA